MARGIYKIINVINNKFYVGSAEDFTRRKRVHWWMLRRGTHANKHLQSAWAKYKEQAFTFVIVEELNEIADILAAENIWLKEHVGKIYCYNIAMDATSPQTGMYGEKNSMFGKTFTHTEDAKARIGAAAKLRIQTEDEKVKRRKSMQGHIIPASVRAKISAKLSGEGNFWYGKQRPDHAEKVSKAVVATDAAGNITTYSSILALREALNIKPPTVNRALKSGKALTRGPYKNWLFKYA
jgi:group I intron endonuclease